MTGKFVIQCPDQGAKPRPFTFYLFTFVISFGLKELPFFSLQHIFALLNSFIVWVYFGIPSISQFCLRGGCGHSDFGI